MEDPKCCAKKLGTLGLLVETQKYIFSLNFPYKMFHGSWGIPTLFRSKSSKWKFDLKTILCTHSHFPESNHNKNLKCKLLDPHRKLFSYPLISRTVVSKFF